MKPIETQQRLAKLRLLHTRITAEMIAMQNPQMDDEELARLIIGVVMDYYSFTPVEFFGRSRSHPLPDARKMASTLIQRFTKMKPPEIAPFICCDRTTVIYNIKRSGELLECDKLFQRDYLTLTHLLCVQ